MHESDIEQGYSHRLVGCGWLAGRLDDPGVRVIEVSSDIDGAAYQAGHIPGAAFWHWKDALWHATDREFATPGEMADRLGAQPQSPASWLAERRSLRHLRPHAGIHNGYHTYG